MNELGAVKPVEQPELGRAAISPDGSQIAASNLEEEHYAISISDLDGSQRQEIYSRDGALPLGLFPLVWSPDGLSLAYGILTSSSQADSGIHVLEIDKGQSTQVTSNTYSEGTGVDTESQWSPDGEWLLSHRHICTQCDGSGSKVVLARADGSGELPLPGADEWTGSASAWAPDGERFAYSADKLYVADKDGSNARAIVELHGSAYSPLEWSPDGEQIYFVRRPSIDPVVYAVHPDGSGLEAMSTDGTIIAPDGQTFARFNEEGGLSLSSQASEESRITKEQLAELGPQRGFYSSWSRDSRYFAIPTDEKGGGDLLGIASIDGDFRVVETPGRMGELRWSPDGGRYAYFASDGIWVGDASSGEPERLSGEPASTAFAWSPDGAEVAFIEDRQVSAQAADGSGQPRALLDLEIDMLGGGALRWSPDGERIAILGPRLTDGQELLVGSVEGVVTEPIFKGVIDALEWSADGDQLVLGILEARTPGRRPGIYLLNPAGGLTVALTDGSHQMLGILADGRILFRSAPIGP